MNAGITMVEVVIMVLILGIIVMLGVPALGATFAEARLYSAYSEIRIALEYAQLTALSTGRTCRVTIGQSAGGAPVVTVEQITYGADFLNGALTELDEADVESESYQTMAYPADPQRTYSLDFEALDMFGGVLLGSSDFGGSNWVVFDVVGAPSSGGTVTLSYSDWQLVINVDSVNGNVSRS